MSDDDSVELLQQIRRKCEQFWNEHNLGDAEVHVTLEFIHTRACKLIAAMTAARPQRETKGKA
jgi:hypothetical protein